MYMDSVTSYFGDAAPAELAPPTVTDAADAAVVRAIVRGEAPLEALEATAIRITASRIQKDGRSKGAAFLMLSAADLAEGLLNRMHNPAGLAEWASFVLVAGELFAFEDRRSEICDRLIAAVWAVAFGGLIGQPAIALAQSLRRRAVLA